MNCDKYRITREASFASWIFHWQRIILIEVIQLFQSIAANSTVIHLTVDASFQSHCVLVYIVCRRVRSTFVIISLKFIRWTVICFFVWSIWSTNDKCFFRVSCQYSPSVNDLGRQVFNGHRTIEARHSFYKWPRTSLPTSDYCSASEAATGESFSRNVGHECCLVCWP